MRLKIVTGVKSFSKPEQPQPKKSKFLSARAKCEIKKNRKISEYSRLIVRKETDKRRILFLTHLSVLRISTVLFHKYC